MSMQSAAEPQGSEHVMARVLINRNDKLVL